MTYKDQHLHYTGSLPLSYIWKKIQECDGDFVNNILFEGLFSKKLSKKLKENDFSNKTYSLFKIGIKELFSDKNNYINNYKNFFKLYKLIQKISKPKKRGEIESNYRESTKAIVSCLSKYEINEFDIFAGPLLDLDKTKSRLWGMISGFEDMQNLSIKGSIRLTFNSIGSHYLNLTQKSLKKLLNFITYDKKVAGYISGFDFSGNEKVDNINIISSTINRLADFNKKTFLQSGKKLKISIHAGENIANISPENYLKFFDRLLNLPIDSIGHGTFLWIPDNFVNYSREINKHRQKLLKKIVEKKIELEICPTSNIIFSPLKSYKDIPFKFFNKIGLKYSINTDNMTILSTNIKTEWKNSISI
jgi:adenosine deaminase